MRKKKKVCLALASAICAAMNAHAQSSVTMYGVVDEYLGYMESRDTKGIKSHFDGVQNGGLTTSFLGFRGTEDLGGGLYATFALESFIRVDTGQIGRNDADPFWGRLSVVGLGGDWGKVTLGRHVTPYSLATTQNTSFLGTTAISPVFTNVYNLNILGGTRLDNAIQYTSQEIGGFRSEVLYSLGSENPSNSVDPRNGRAFEAVGIYTRGPLRLTGGYHYINQNSKGDGHDQNAWMVAVVYDFNVVKLNAQYHQVRDEFNKSANNAKRHVWEAGATVPVGAGNILASYATTHADDLLPNTPASRATWALAYDYFLSKRTDVYFGYYKDKLYTPNSQSSILAAGVRHRF